jgi:hypothetical protein
MSAFTDKVVSQCLTEFARFKNGKGRETKDPFAGFVGEYWDFGLKKKGIDGRTIFTDAKGKPVSAGVVGSIHFLHHAQERRGGCLFYHEGHIHYVVKAIRDAKIIGTTAKFLGRDPKTHVPKVGDLINAGRGAAKSVTFANVLAKYGPKKVDQGNFLPSHTDIVIDVDKKLTTIGGNVDDTVGKKIWNLNNGRHIGEGPSLICVIECLL